mgnify:CR=1 FL=1
MCASLVDFCLCLHISGLSSAFFYTFFFFFEGGGGRSPVNPILVIPVRLGVSFSIAFLCLPMQLLSVISPFFQARFSPLFSPS